MPRLIWDQTGERIYETGTDHGVVYPISKDFKYPKGYAWIGLTAVTESPSGAEANPIWADNIKYVTLRSVEEFGFTIEAYTYPDAWHECDGCTEPIKGVAVGQQKRKAFGFSYRSKIGNDTELDSHGYKLHLIYNSTASPSERAFASMNDNPEAITFSWECSSTPVPVTFKDAEGNDLNPVANITIDSTAVDAAKLKSLEDMLYGTADAEAMLPLPDDVFKLFGGGTTPSNPSSEG